MKINMKVTGKTEFVNGPNTTTNINLISVEDSADTKKTTGNLAISTTDQEFADSINFHNVVAVTIEASTN